MALKKLGPIFLGSTHPRLWVKKFVFMRHAWALQVVLKLEIWHGSAGRIGKSISAKIRIYTNASRFQS